MLRPCTRSFGWFLATYGELHTQAATATGSDPRYIPHCFGLSKAVLGQALGLEPSLKNREPLHRHGPYSGMSVSVPVNMHHQGSLLPNPQRQTSALGSRKHPVTDLRDLKPDLDQIDQKSSTLACDTTGQPSRKKKSAFPRMRARAPACIKASRSPGESFRLTGLHRAGEQDPRSDGV